MDSLIDFWSQTVGFIDCIFKTVTAIVRLWFCCATSQRSSFMRLLNICVIFLYLSLLVSGQTRSAAQAWVDHAETSFTTNQTLLSQQTPKVVDAETPKDPETKYSGIYHPAAIAPVFRTENTMAATQLLWSGQSIFSNSSPRAPPFFA